MKRRLISGEELIRKIIEAERNFSQVRLAQGCDLSVLDGYQEMLDYLHAHEGEFCTDPVNISLSEFKKVRAPGLYLPYASGKGVSFRGADLSGVNFYSADLAGSDFRESELCSGHKPKATKTKKGAGDIGRADFNHSDLRGACLYGTTCYQTDFRWADLRGAQGLEDAKELGDAHFYKTVATPIEAGIILLARRQVELFSSKKE